MDIFFEPTALAGLATLVLLEIVLGIDNLVFIAILSNKLPPEERQRARMIGLSLALGMRMVLLMSISWMVTLTAPLFWVSDHAVSGRDLIMLFGGVFLIFKGTMELHEKLEGVRHKTGGAVRYARFWQVILQIVILDAVFSLDAVITAVGMANYLPVMILAVVIAMVIMMLASNRLMQFVSQFPTVIILCLGFLLMIGFSLLLEGVGYHIPKGYLYAAIGFSVIIEGINQTMQRKRNKTYAAIDPRTRVTDAVLSLLGGRAENEDVQDSLSPLAPKSHELDTFQPQERLIIQRTLRLSGISVAALMTPRQEIYWVNINDSAEELRADIRKCPYACMVVCEDGQLDTPLGLLYKKQLADALLENQDLIDFRPLIKNPLVLPHSVNALDAMATFQKSRQHIAFIVDEYGSLEGLLTLTDLAEAMIGDMPEAHDQDSFTFVIETDGSLLLNGALTINDMREIIYPLQLPEGDYNTVAGLVLAVLRKIPQAGVQLRVDRWKIKVEEMDKRRIKRVRFTFIDEAPDML